MPPTANWRAQMMDSQPATPSKSKPGRRPCSLTTLLVLFAVLAGLALFGQELSGGGRTETYYRKALVARMYFGADGQQAVAAAAEEVHRTTTGGAAGGEDGNRAALELPGGQLGLGVQQGLAGDAGAAVAPDPRLKQPAAEAAAAAAAAQLAASQAAAAAAALQAQAAAQAAAAAAAQQVQQAAAAGGAVVQQEEDKWVNEPEPVGAAGVAAWYSNIVAVTGERLPKAEQKERDISASLATAVTFDESAVEDRPDCKIAVLDVDKEWGHRWGAGTCDLRDPGQWPFAAAGRGIDGADSLAPEAYQYSQEHWLAQAIRNSSRFSPDVATADFVFVDLHCYHTAWMAWLHPLNEAGRQAQPSPEYHIRRALAALQGMKRFRETKGGDFGVVHPAPLMKGLLSEDTACEDLASVLNMVPERQLLCVWTQDSHRAGKSVILPYAAVSDIDIEAPVVPSAERETFLFFRGGCGSTDPAVRPYFAAGKMLRWALVRALNAAPQPDVHAGCTCDICTGHMPHKELVQRMGRSVFCPIVASNTQSSRRLSEAILTGCIPVFIGEPFHSLPLASDVDYKSFAVFINVTDTSSWVNASSPKWEHNHMIRKAWKLDDPSLASSMISVARLEDVVGVLRAMPADQVAARQAALLANRLKFWYPAASAAAYTASGGAVPTAGAPGGSELAEILMRKMCRRAAAVGSRLSEARQQGLDFGDQDLKIEHPALAGGTAAGGAGDEGAAAAAAADGGVLTTEQGVEAMAAAAVANGADAAKPADGAAGAAAAAGEAGQAQQQAQQQQGGGAAQSERRLTV
ncbi:Dihydrolipoyllysine-residue acetyltransferase component of pyruvate dehydrogenase complex [Chlorella sorokiniana]|uniref:Dihydrolipoyllysine-residue acetyltransferase component of pyruvate dehydrogenase complex n=1 Tax=Chlorella sorokiniana TaxID=3076 RepID=A0A2P6TNW2_CHLSO|nr:Dihydrolipoyllysine-residue acetyltransferase component of pyruvate dehydrogenase complex [Chlorella sorokiniana]|eukprot:PRW51030.1 Dihydrolipoyllysine-residue acetyltransferase component of pyruvate dehydrogenase complex [Chlorella sorokiniana]